MCCTDGGAEEASLVNDLGQRFKESKVLEREGNGNSLQYSCLENPVNRGAWQVRVYGVTKSWTRLKWFSTHTCTKGYKSVFMGEEHFTHQK